MKLMFASDIHGSYYYGKRVIDIYKEEKAERLILLGDILYHGPRNELPKGHDPKSLTVLLNEYKNEILCVRGNCDAEVDQMVLEFPITADYLTLFEGGRTFYITHGHLFDEQKPMPHKAGDVFIYGHIHIPVARKTDDFYAFNPGSVSLPKENSKNSYMIYENGTFTIKDLEGNTVKELTL